MDDLISRKAAIDAIRNTPISVNGCASVSAAIIAMGNIDRINKVIADQPTIPAVPLDKLCEWFANKAKLPAPCYYVESYCPYNDFGHCELDAPDLTECWERVLTKWMEDEHDTE